MSLDGKIALITGAVKGIGRAFSEILLKNGAKVSLLDINTSEGNELKTLFDSAYGEGRTCFIRCDVSSETELNDAFQKTIETFGRLDIICNNAGILDEKDWEKMVSVNLNGVIRGTLLGLKHMKKEEGGVIVNVSSLAGLGPLPSAPVYTATKHGVVGFSRALADGSSLLGLGIRINVLCPAFVDTHFFKSEINETLAAIQDARNKLFHQFGVLQPSEVAESFLQLVTDKSKNGAVLHIMKNGGAHYMDISKMKNALID
ncbi:15-hydroxyprostaglandin dehydrogenase [NAD(+)]-like [Polypterus senegalus]|uniref:15-hydroxyprostaglandin dehydrogenase [NAD(+)]-like n=1 Tax=Polypterus senegalus TaxID=55291 RepID=UPI001966A997|nr:15-hydroxyprostaglandin dehydrogenase [NAD(+)]-like [Polypterus senegalus]XP_039631864.1 15-hydroxyprostaglandin dehydrogenase [NAD(+)]-like [Polypterus senegalus]